MKRCHVVDVCIFLLPSSTLSDPIILIGTEYQGSAEDEILTIHRQEKHIRAKITNDHAFNMAINPSCVLN